MPDFAAAAEQAIAALVGSLTRGQFFSLFMFVFAALFLLHAWRGRKENKS